MGRGDCGRRGARRRTPARLPAAAEAAGHGRGVEGPACGAVHCPEGGRRVVGVPGRRCEPRARGRFGEDGGRAWHLGLGATQARRARASDEHAERDVRSVRWPSVISDPGDGSRGRARAPKGRAPRRHAGRGSAFLHGRVRRVLSDRGVDIRWDLHAAVLQVRGLAAARGRSARLGRWGAGADHRRRDRPPHTTHRAARQSDDPARDDRGNRVRARRRRAAADAD